jgi:hypothetical protein
VGKGGNRSDRETHGSEEKSERVAHGIS